MVIKTSGTLSIANDIAGEFGGQTPHSISEYYRGGSLVPNTSQNLSIPSVINSSISFSDFYGTVSTFVYTIAESVQEINLRTYLIDKGWDGNDPVQLTLGANRYLWSDSTSVSAVTTGTFPNGLIFTNNGFIMGKGGNGGTPSSPNGRAGGTAISLSTACSIINNGYIGGGGGGGGAYFREYYSGGGGGAGGGNGGPNSRYGGGGTGLGGAIGSLGANGNGAVAELNGSGGSAGGGGGGYDQQNLSRDEVGGGGGGGRIFPGTRTDTKREGAGYGGGSNEVGGNVTSRGAGGGGGWGANGGSGNAGNGGNGGAAIRKNGFTLNLTGTTSRVYGSVV
jgi:hypothetical protein